MGRLIGELSLLWLLAAAVTAAFAPRTVLFNAASQINIPGTTVGAGLTVVVPAVGICFGLWWLLRHGFAGPLAVAAGGIFVLALVLPHPMTGFFLPPPFGLALAAWLLRGTPGGVDPEE